MQQMLIDIKTGIKYCSQKYYEMNITISGKYHCYLIKSCNHENLFTCSKL